MTQRRSLAANIDPLAKLIALLIVGVSSAFTDRLADILVWTAAVIALLLSLSADEARRSLKFLWLVLFVPTLLVVFHLLILPTMSGNPLGRTRAIEDALFYSLRMFNAVLMLVWILVSTDTRNVVQRVAAAGVPGSLAFSLYLMLRFVDLLATHAQSVKEAMIMRHGGWANAAFLRSWFQHYVASLLLFGVLRADSTAMAMDLRGFGSSTRRTYINSRRWSFLGWLLPLMFAAVAGTMILWPLPRLW